MEQDQKIYSGRTNPNKLDSHVDPGTNPQNGQARQEMQKESNGQECFACQEHHSPEATDSPLYSKYAFSIFSFFYITLFLCLSF
jgi:hypothetical protein